MKPALYCCSSLMTTESAGRISPPLWELGLRVVQKQLLLTILMNYKFVNGLARITEKSGLNADEFNEGIRIEPKIPDF